MSKDDYKGHATATLWYPRAEESRKHVTIELMDVRAADDLRIEYDFDRDGYVIKQQRWAGGMRSFGGDYEEWVEVAFIEAWKAACSCTSASVRCLAIACCLFKTD